jgi:hypothetical protein
VLQANLLKQWLLPSVLKVLLAALAHVWRLHPVLAAGAAVASKPQFADVSSTQGYKTSMHTSKVSAVFYT